MINTTILKKPKLTGYRGIHDFYQYDVNSEHGSRYRGLSIELQYRTKFQHAWATTVEVVGLITESQPKFQEGDRRYEEILSISSEIIARVFESSRSCHPDIDDDLLIKRFIELDTELGFMQLLRSLNSTDKTITKNKNIILMFSETDKLEVKSYRDATEALKALFELEKQNPGKDVVLVKADSSDDVRTAFRNYFSDSGEFLKLIEEGCQKLSGKTVVRMPKQLR